MKKIISYIVAGFIGLVVVAPPINFDIPTMINSRLWAFYVIASALFSVYLWFTSIHWSLKGISVVSFLTCFLSQSPHSSFNAYILLVATMYAYLLIKETDFDIVFKMIEAAFWVQVCFLVIQHFGMDTLINFDRPEKLFFGTIAVPMRMGSLFAVMTPILLIRSKLYLIPLIILSVASGTLGFSFALCFGFAVWMYLTRWPLNNTEWTLIGATLIFAIVCAFLSWTHIYVEIVEGRLPVWWVIIKSWVLDTKGRMILMPPHEWIWDPTFHNSIKPDIFGARQTGPVCLQTILFGHGLDTFLPMFPFYKHDPNPFPNPHNDFLKILWEGGIVLFSLFSIFVVNLIKRLLSKIEFKKVAGLAIIGMNMFFAFPMCMTQTIVLMIVYIAWCQNSLEERV